MGMDKVKAGARRHQQLALQSLKCVVSRPLAIIINSSFEHHVPIETLGEETPSRVRLLPLAYIKGVSSVMICINQQVQRPNVPISIASV